MPNLRDVHNGMNYPSLACGLNNALRTHAHVPCELIMDAPPPRHNKF